MYLILYVIVLKIVPVSLCKAFSFVRQKSVNS